jgi:hypothetical protein
MSQVSLAATHAVALVEWRCVGGRALAVEAELIDRRGLKLLVYAALSY